MQSTQDIAAVIAIASFLGAIIGAALSNLVSARLAAQERKEARRKEKLDSLTQAQKSLMKAYSDLQTMALEAQKANLVQPVCEAAAVLLSIDDDELHQIAIDRLVDDKSGTIVGTKPAS